jgi:ATP-dependent DNA helicase RecG
METPTWSSDGGFVTITFKRSDFKSDIIENDKEDKKITEVLK